MRTSLKLHVQATLQEMMFGFPTCSELLMKRQIRLKPPSTLQLRERCGACSARLSSPYICCRKLSSQFQSSPWNLRKTGRGASGTHIGCVHGVSHWLVHGVSHWLLAWCFTLVACMVSERRMLAGCSSGCLLLSALGLSCQVCGSWHSDLS